MKLPGAVLLDLDNTVYEYAPCQKRAMQAAHPIAAAARKEWESFEVFSNDYDAARALIQRQLPGHSASHCRLLYFKTLIEMRCGKSDLAAVIRLHDAFWKGFFAVMKVDAGCQEVLAAWKKRGARLAWVTNFTTERQVQKLQALGLETAADFLVTSEEAGADKPSPLPFQLAMKKLGVEPKDCLMIGDDWKSDIEPSEKLGIRSVWCRRGISPEKWPGSAAWPAFDSWSELSQLFS